MSIDNDKPIHYRFDLDCQLQTCIDEYEQEREQVWQNRLEGLIWGIHGLFGHSEAVANSLLRDTNDLVDHESLIDVPVQFTQEQKNFLRASKFTGFRIVKLAV